MLVRVIEKQTSRRKRTTTILYSLNTKGWELKALSYPFTAFLNLWCIVQQLPHVITPADHPPTAPEVLLSHQSNQMIARAKGTRRPRQLCSSVNHLAPPQTKPTHPDFTLNPDHKLNSFTEDELFTNVNTPAVVRQYIYMVDSKNTMLIGQHGFVTLQ